ncbi:filamentous hemagglutinin N-terminal domain-containing protein [Serratia sp. NPDC078593]|uniref:two-partner secretion domain-containing protein n=1 Tax=unclassified Serratia (in: enterobacteria) TaxID=2647522 RepID=UPI0037D19566
MKNTNMVINPLVLSIALAFTGSAFAVGTGTIVNGAGNISKNANTTVVNQNSDKMVIHWNNMNVNGNETLQFNQASSQSSVLNKVNSTTATMIRGALKANGNVFIVNPNGVLIGNSARVNVGSLVVSSLDIKDSDFQKGNLHFTGSTKGKVTNEGSIQAANSVALIGARGVTNTGVIQSTNGNINLASGSDVTLSFPSLGKMNVKVNSASLDALIKNNGVIITRNGSVALTAWAKDQLTRDVINASSGIVEAHAMNKNSDGSVSLISHGNGNVNIGGRFNIDNDLKIAAQNDVTYKTSLNAGGKLDISANNIKTVGNVYEKSQLTSKKDAVLTAKNNIDIGLIQAGSYLTKGNVTLNGNNITATDIQGSDVNIHAGKSLNASRLIGNNIDIVALDKVNFSADGLVQSIGDMNITANNGILLPSFVRSFGTTSMTTKGNIVQGMGWMNPEFYSEGDVDFNVSKTSKIMNSKGGKLNIETYGDVNTIIN